MFAKVPFSLVQNPLLLLSRQEGGLQPLTFSEPGKERHAYRKKKFYTGSMHRNTHIYIYILFTFFVGPNHLSHPLYKYSCIFPYIHTYIYTYTYIYTCTHTYIYTCMYTNTCVYIYIYVWWIEQNKSSMSRFH